MSNRTRRRFVRRVGLLVLVTLCLLAVRGWIRWHDAVPPPAMRAVLNTVSLPGHPPRLPWPASGEAVVEVAGLGRLGSFGPAAPVPIASLAKVMTAEVVLSDHPLGDAGGRPLSFTAADAADAVARARTGQSVLPVYAGERLSERQALAALLVGSANNVAVKLATWDAGSVSAFLARMNRTARRLGMRHTRYTDPSGLAASTVSTASDQLRLADAALRQPGLAQLAGLPFVRLPLAGVVRNYDSLVGHDSVFGIKTGSTLAAGGSFMFAARRAVHGQEQTVVGVVLRQFSNPPSVTGVLDAALSAGRQLVDAAFRDLRSFQVLAPGTRVAVLTSADHRHVAVVAAGRAVLVGWPGLSARLVLRTGSLPTQARAGAAAGAVLVRLAGETRTVRLRLRTALDAPSVLWRVLHG
jgi:D-alanyl-D-alanine carboxypeptidase (penicillin-binding protein 5/6)